MLPKRFNMAIRQQDLRPSLVKEMQEKEQEKALCSENDILPYFFYKATQHQPLHLKEYDVLGPTLGKGLIFESAFRAETSEEEALNIEYANSCALSVLNGGNIPYGSHIKYTNFLRDANKHERTVGIVFGKLEEITIPYVSVFFQRGISFGMIKGLELHTYLNKHVFISGLKAWPENKIMLSPEDANQQIQNEIVIPQIDIIQYIDEIIGVNTLD